jgi:hypothetical protein
VSKKSSDWYIPPDWAFQLFGWVSIFLSLALVSILSSGLNQLQAANIFYLFWSGLGLGALGIILLFSARLPLYRQRRFFTFGPKALPAFHRKLYWLAYAAVVAGVLLLGVVWLRIK